VVSYFLWDGDNLFAELSGTTGNKVAEYSYYPGLDHVHALIVGDARYYAHDDGVGNVIALTGEDQRVKRTYDYAGPWGAITGGVDSVGFNNVDRARFKGALWMGPEVDLYYMRNRWYSPLEGRFWSEDPIGLAGGINPYLFAGDDPVNGSDPTGLTQAPCIDWYTVVDGVGRYSHSTGSCGAGGGGPALPPWPGWPGGWAGYVPGNQTSPHGPGGSGRSVRSQPRPEQRAQRAQGVDWSACGGSLITVAFATVQSAVWAGAIAAGEPQFAMLGARTVGAAATMLRYSVIGMGMNAVVDARTGRSPNGLAMVVGFFAPPVTLGRSIWRAANACTTGP
jgi:RHS repeat-associated protein